MGDTWCVGTPGGRGFGPRCSLSVMQPLEAFNLFQKANTSRVNASFAAFIIWPIDGSISFFFFAKQQIWIFKCGGWKMTSNYANKGSCMSGHVPLDKLQPWASFTCKRRMTRGTSESKCADWWMLPGLFWMRLSAQKGTSLDLFIALDLNVIRAVISLVTWLPLFFNEIPSKLRRKWRQF